MKLLTDEEVAKLREALKRLSPWFAPELRSLCAESLAILDSAPTVEQAGCFVAEGWNILGNVTDWAQVMNGHGTPLYARTEADSSNGQPQTCGPVLASHEIGKRDTAELTDAGIIELIKSAGFKTWDSRMFRLARLSIESRARTEGK